MTLILKLDLDMVKMYLYTEDEVPSYGSSKVIAWTDTQIDRHTDRQTDLSEIITYPHADGNKPRNFIICCFVLEDNLLVFISFVYSAFG